MIAPMTFIVTLGLIFAVVAGLIILTRALDGGRKTRRDLKLGTQARCPQCRQANPTHAKYCAKCGKHLT